MNAIKLIGWRQDGTVIPDLEGYNVYDYFRHGRYLGADRDGVEPILQIRFEDGVHVTQYFTNENPEGWQLVGYDGVLRNIADDGEIAEAFASAVGGN